MRRPTSHDVARLARVSQTTVSLVLSGREARIPEATRQRVLQAARDVGYAVSAAGRVLSTGRTMRIGFVPESPKKIINNAYFHRVLAGLIDATTEAGYSLLLQTQGFDDLDQLAGEILGRSADVAVLLGRTLNDPLAARLADAEFPALCVAYRPKGCETPVIDVDKFAEGRMIAEALLEKGHRVVSFLYSEIDNTWNQFLYEGLSSVPGLTLSLYAKLADTSLEALRGAGCTALVFADEAQAWEALFILSERGEPVPESFSVISILHLNSPIRNGLAGPVEPLEAIGRLAGESAVRLAAGETIEPLTVLPVSWNPGATLGQGPAGRG